MRAFISGGGGGGGPSDDSSEKHCKKLKELVADLDDLTSPDSKVNRLGSSVLTAALHEEDSRGIVLWAVLRPFLKGYALMFPQSKVPLPANEVSANIDVMLDQGNFFLTQQLIKRHLRDEPPLSLGGLAEIRYPRGSASWERYQQTLAREIFDHARDIQLWHVDVLGRADRNGGGAIAGYKVSAGRALIDFDEWVFQPKRRDQFLRFHARFHDDLKENGHA
ncbi:MAG: hypothetical protein EOR04_11480 [Mesorhizobium sp.]|uniref:hypothetical protein n=1 Tax=Mesorhizobium sp. TaxID=1871066 RepID=UPI000FE54C51|nr:hypothetical protein [Mesorhizobium sp.]RWP42430.1 MAG: hypothetical protein EOR04_11480 [Mesorhizobium sp.]